MKYLKLFESIKFDDIDITDEDIKEIFIDFIDDFDIKIHSKKVLQNKFIKDDNVHLTPLSYIDVTLISKNSSYLNKYIDSEFLIRLKEIESKLNDYDLKVSKIHGLYIDKNMHVRTSNYINSIKILIYKR